MSSENQSIRVPRSACRRLSTVTIGRVHLRRTERRKGLRFARCSQFPDRCALELEPTVRPEPPDGIQPRDTSTYDELDGFPRAQRELRLTTSERGDGDQVLDPRRMGARSDLDLDRLAVSDLSDGLTVDHDPVRVPAVGQQPWRTGESEDTHAETLGRGGQPCWSWLRAFLDVPFASRSASCNSTAVYRRGHRVPSGEDLRRARGQTGVRPHRYRGFCHIARSRSPLAGRG
jgi:hypothetical protein